MPSLEHARTVLLGACELHSIGGGAAEVSYWTHPRHRGRGVASAALRRLCGRAFARPGLRRLHLEADADNPASRRVALNAGFRQAGEAGGRVRYTLEAGG